MNCKELRQVSPLGRIVRYLWFTAVMRLTGWLPDMTPVCRLRGLLLRPCFRRCGRNLQIQRNVEIKAPEWVEIGNDVLIAQGCWLNGLVTLDHEVLLAPYVVLSGGNHTRSAGSYRFAAPDIQPIRIGRGSWIGAHATVTPGVTIGAGVAIGANAVVTRDVPDETIACGVPARPFPSVDAAR
jgi:acetyltransferase-like isoleucine patch superfamily enzyme